MKNMKIRIWDPNKKEMIMPSEFIQLDKLYVGYFDDSGYPHIENEQEPMLYTGHKDCSGIEMYEHDVIKILIPSDDPDDPEDIVEYAVLEFDHGTFYLLGSNFYDTLEKLITDVGFFWQSDPSWEVIGNIYEELPYEVESHLEGYLPIKTSKKEKED